MSKLRGGLELTVHYLKKSLKVARQVEGWDETDPESAAYYRGVEAVATVALIFLGEPLDEE